MDNSFIDKEILNFKNLFSSFYQEKILIITTTLIFALFSVFYALSIVNKYSSEAKLISSLELDSSSGNINLSNIDLGGLANLVGGGGSNIDSNPRTKLAKELLTSKEFINQFVKRRNILVPLMAGKSWNVEKNKININQKIYDERTESWQRESTFLIGSAPSRDEVFNKFISNFQIQRSKEGIFLISLISLSPLTSQQWLSWLIEDVNNEIRKKEVLLSEQRIGFLLNELKSERIASTKEAISAVLKKEYTQLMLANTREDFVFTLIDPPSRASYRDGIPRSIICILITTLGFFFSLLIVILKNYIKFFK